MLLLLVFSSLSKITAQDYLPDGITLRTQEQIYNFPKNYLGSTQILKDVHLQESIAENITNLNSLYQSIKINGNFSVSNNTSLNSLNGLENLTSIGEYLKGKNNTSLTSFSGRDNLTSIGGYMDIYDNASLVNPGSLKNPTIVGEIIHKKPKPPYRTWVIPIDNSPIIKGYLNEIGDSEIVISNISNSKRQSININNVKKIKFREKGRIGKGILIGALTGLAVGGIMGLASGDDRNGFYQFTKEEKALMSGILLAVPGALIGGVIGSIKIKIPINGNAKNQKERLLKYKLSY